MVIVALRETYRRRSPKPFPGGRATAGCRYPLRSSSAAFRVPQRQAFARSLGKLAFDWSR
jgi:hypothetical protein